MATLAFILAFWGPSELRSIVLHYHLFKNAGTSLDAILRQNFGEAWVTQEFPQGSACNGPQVSEWIESHPQACAFSSHTMTGPLPSLDAIRAIPILMLRDPLARIRSAYLFESQQKVDTLGSRLAKAHDLNGYVMARLNFAGDRQCRNFHTTILARMTPGSEDELTRAMASITRLREIGVIGLVERFEDTMDRLAARLRPIWPSFEVRHVRVNTSDKFGHAEIGPELEATLREANAQDLKLLDWVKTTF